MRLLYFSRSYTPHDRRFLAAFAASTHETYYLRLEDDRVRYETRPVPQGVRVLEPLGGGKPVSPSSVTVHPGKAAWMSFWLTPRGSGPLRRGFHASFPVKCETLSIRDTIADPAGLSEHRVKEP